MTAQSLLFVFPNTSSWKNSSRALGMQKLTTSTVDGVSLSDLITSTLRTSLPCFGRNANPLCSVPVGGSNDGRGAKALDPAAGWTSYAWQERSPFE